MEKVVSLVTGGARGIGREISIKLAERGDMVVVNYRSSSKEAEELCSKINADGGEAIAFKADVANGDEVKAMLEFVKENFGQLDVLVNNAGICRDKSILAMTDEDFAEVLGVNLAGPFRCIRESVRLLRKSVRACIINIGSSGAIRGNPGQAGYAASKGGVLSLTRSLSRELAPRGIRVNAVVPGFVGSDMTAGLDEKHWQKIIDETPTGKLSSAEDIAWAVEFLSSPRARNISGQTIVVDGGRI